MVGMWDRERDADRDLGAILADFGQVLFFSQDPSAQARLLTCGPQSCPSQKIEKKSRLETVRKLYSTCASPVVPHPSTGHAHGCLASEIGRDPAFPTRFDRTVASLEVSLLAPSQELERDRNKNNIRRSVKKDIIT